MTKPLFVAVLALFSASAASAQTARSSRSSDAAFNAAVEDINDSVSKLVAAQRRTSASAQAQLKAAAVVSCTPAQIDAAYAEVPRCEDAMKKAFGVSVRDGSGALAKGFSRGGYSLVLLTTTDAFFYHEDCDICAAVERCSLKSGAITNFKTAHSVDCGDLAPFLKKGVAYSACPLH